MWIVSNKDRTPFKYPKVRDLSADGVRNSLGNSWGNLHLEASCRWREQLIREVFDENRSVPVSRLVVHYLSHVMSITAAHALHV